MDNDVTPSDVSLDWHFENDVVRRACREGFSIFSCGRAGTCLLAKYKTIPSTEENKDSWMLQKWVIGVIVSSVRHLYYSSESSSKRAEEERSLARLKDPTMQSSEQQELFWVRMKYAVSLSFTPLKRESPVQHVPIQRIRIYRPLLLLSIGSLRCCTNAAWIRTNVRWMDWKRLFSLFRVELFLVALFVHCKWCYVDVKFCNCVYGPLRSPREKGGDI